MGTTKRQEMEGEKKGSDTFAFTGQKVKHK